MNTSSSIYRTGAALLLLCGMGLPSSSWAQTASFDGPAVFDVGEDVRFPDIFSSPSSSMPSMASNNQTPRMRLFRFAPGFLADPLSMQEEEMGLPGVTTMPGFSPAGTPAEPAGEREWFQLGMGLDNPNFDLRLPGDPGGVGYYRVNTQVSLLDSPTTACSLGVQAVTPSGAQFAGLPDGATVLCPTFSVFHAVNDSLAIQGFFSKNVPILNADSSAAIQRNLQYGMALQRPLFTYGPKPLRNLFVSVGALGQMSPERDNFHLIPNYDVLPGLHWFLSDSWWVSSAVLMPFGSDRSGPSQWQLTCSLHF